MRKAINQGDVLLVPVSPKSVPEGKPIPTENGRVILAHGEVTGHAHAFTNPQDLNFIINEQGLRFLQVKAKSTLKHEEHFHLDVEPGWYEVITPVEYQPNELPRAVLD